MQFLVTGATGFIGTRLCDALVGRGHRVKVLSRNPSGAGFLPATEVYEWDPNHGQPPLEALAGVDAVVHLAGETVSGRWTAKKKASIQRSRTVGTRRLVEAIGRLERPPTALVSASATGYYGDRGDEPLTEKSSRGRGFLSDVCASWEQEAAKAEAFGVRVAQLRLGLVLGVEGGALPPLMPLFRFGLGGPIGNGRQWWSWAHIDDVTELFSFVVEKELTGPINATAPHPARQREFAAALGGVLRRPAFLPAPAAAMRLALGEFSSELLASRRVVPEKATAAGFAFRFPELKEALKDLTPRFP